MRSCFSLFVLPVVTMGMVHAQGVLEPATLDRPEEFLELEAGELAGVLGQPNDQLAVYAWHDGAFVAIPYQVDEVGPSGGYFGEDEDPGNLDANDQIVCSLEDAGDRVDCAVWAAGADTTRFEIEVEDPLNPGAKAWVYLFTGEGIPQSAVDYVSVTNDNPFQVTADRYQEGFLLDGPATQTDMVIFPELGSGSDFMDRLKLRTKLFALGGWDTEEDSAIDEARHFVKDGPVRVINSFWISLGDLVDLSHVTVTFYRQMTTVDNSVNQVLITGVKGMVWLEDMAPIADGSFYYHDNRGSDPEADATFTDLVDGDGAAAQIGDPAFFYEWASATHGRTIFIQDTQPVMDTGASVNSYYCDNCPTAPWSDTGDMEKWGEFGTWMKNIPLSHFDLEAWNFRLSGANPEVSVGGEYVRRYFHRVTRSVTTQNQCPVSIAGDTPGAPARRARLEQNVPNPFNPRTEIAFVVPDGNTGQTLLRVFDLQGRVVRTLVAGTLAPGEHRVTWDGTDDSGAVLPSGIYLDRLESNGQVLTNRMLLVK